MVKCFISVFLVFVSSFLYGQMMLGVKTSYTNSFVGSSEQLYDNSQDFVIYRLELDRQQVLPSIGIIAYYEFVNGFENRNLTAYAQIESLFNYRRTHFTFENYLSNASPAIRAYRKGVGFIRFPVLGGLEYKFLKFGIGPIFSFVISEEKVFTSFPNIDERFRTFEPAASALLGVRVDDFVLDISYEYHFNGVSEFIYYRDQVSGFKEQPHYLSLNASYFFRLKPAPRRY